ncbi:MAG TPA: alpha/beta hydrolase [Amnibacterium sp.]|jgi:pimeloyl-ACP methyl ester carboxylesterase|uniref:alpha/beta fold hydrolase n=1 Tax=Amnibacterium sp. TaxID=1872496 RepID=UPI002F95C4CD
MLVPIGAGTCLDVEDTGRGPVVVLVHGWPVTALHWRHVIPALTQSGYRAVAIEARGLGENSTGSGDLSKATLAGEVLAVLDALGIGRFAVVGHDWGGTIAVLMAAQQPGRVAAVVVEEDVPPGIEVEATESETYPTWHLPLFQAPEGVAERLLAGRHDATVDAYLDGSAGPSGLDFDAQFAYMGAYAGDDHLKTTLALYRAEQADAQAVRRATRRRLQVPGLAVAGRFGRGRQVAEALSRSVSRVHAVVAADAGHYPAEQAPDTVNRALIPFLRAA